MQHCLIFRPRTNGCSSLEGGNGGRSGFHIVSWIYLPLQQQDPSGDDSEARMEPQLLKQPLLNYGQELLTALKEEQGIERVGFALQGISRADLQASKQRDAKDPL